MLSDEEQRRRSDSLALYRETMLRAAVKKLLRSLTAFPGVQRRREVADAIAEVERALEITR